MSVGCGWIFREQTRRLARTILSRVKKMVALRLVTPWGTAMTTAMTGASGDCIVPVAKTSCNKDDADANYIGPRRRRGELKQRINVIKLQ